jgi:tetratricopeptide (TPR) repeat protein
MYSVLFSALLTVGSGVGMLVVPFSPQDRDGRAASAPESNNRKTGTKYATAKEAFQVGAAFYNSRNYKSSREPFEAALRMSGDDQEMQLKCYKALLASYRNIPEFEPFRTAAEYIITNDKRDASRSLTRRSYLSFAYNRGQLANLVKRYEKQLKSNPDDRTALYLLSEIYSKGAGLPPSIDHSKRAIELIEHLAKLEGQQREAAGEEPIEMSAAEAAKISREKAKLARQYMQAKEYKKSAELYEEIASLDATTHAWNLKEAASAWLKLGDRENALRLALAAEKVPAESRNDQLTHFFERNLGDTFMAVGQPKKAIPHYEIAIQKTTIEGYVKDTRASLQEATDKSQ